MTSLRYILALVGTIVTVTAASAQTAQTGSSVAIGGGFGIQMAAGAGDIAFMASPIGIESESVSGAPYSAEAVTEVVQPFADGNRIFRSSKVQIARDSTGRTRREQGLAILGPKVSELEGLRHVQITDPESRTVILLDMKNKMAHRMPMPNIRLMTKITDQGGPVITKMDDRRDTFEVEVSAPPRPIGEFGVTVFQGADAAGIVTSLRADKPVTESLGKQTIEGVEVDGTRTTSTIPAGEIGNDQPITIVSERWYSPDLKVLVMSRQSDPRFGETTYRLTNIVRADPDPALFEVPADFTVK